MLQFSVPAGRWMGVYVRVHASYLLLLALAGGYSLASYGEITRGVALWLALCAAVVVRELSRVVAAAYFGMSPRALFLMPVGGVMAHSAQSVGAPMKNPTTLSWIGSAANFVVALLLLGFAYGVDPHVRLLDQPWITMERILRSVVWLQVIVGVINLLPFSSVSAPKLTGASSVLPALRSGEERNTRTAFGVWVAFALASALSGILSGLLWPVLLGITVLLIVYVNRAAGVASIAALPVVVGDVMSTEFRPLSASSTLQDALKLTTHSLHESFPVLRGERLVGWVSRAALVARLRMDGDGFLQGIMSRSLQAAEPTEKIALALRRAAALGASEFIPVVEGGAMVGLLTPGGLERAMNQLRWAKTWAERDQQ